MRNRKHEIDVAMRRGTADISINNIDVVDVFASKIIKNQSVAIVNKMIVAISETPYEAKKSIDGKGQVLIPGLIDPHIHIESSYVAPDEFIKLVAQHGTTTAMVDSHEIANTNGIEGIEYFFKFTDSPFNLINWVPSCVPASKWELSFKDLTADLMEPLYKHESVIGIGEMMDFIGISKGEQTPISKIASAWNNNVLVDGHASNATGDKLNAYLSQSITAEHECRTEKEVNEKLSKGFQINLRYGDKSKNLPELIHTVNKDNLSFFSICGDDINAKVLLEEGHLDRAYLSVKDKVKNISKIDLIKMMTINTARANNLRFVGGIAPGYSADLVIVDNLDSFKVQTTISNGKIIWDGNKTHHLDFNVESPKSNFKHKEFNSNDFDVNFENEQEVAILAHGFNTDITKISVKNEKGNAIPLEEGVAKISMIDRYNRTKADNFTAFVKDFQINSGAIAQTINHDSHCTTVVGTNDSDMAFAVNKIKEFGGGFIAVKNGEVIAKVELPIGGLMSNKPHEEWIKDWDNFMNKSKELLDENAENPVLKLRGIGLTVIPILRISLFGLLDVENDKIIKHNYKLK